MGHESVTEIMMSSLFALSLAVCAIVSVVVLIARFRINPFIVLFAVSLALALCAGMPPQRPSPRSRPAQDGCWGM